MVEGHRVLNKLLVKGESMVDTSILENIAEDYVSHQLQSNGLLVAKPKNDQLGTDLLVFNEIDDGVKFCRLQVKGRSFKTSRNTNIRIPVDYVSNAFILFLFIDMSENSHESQGKLYIFFPQEVEQWSVTKNNEYQLNLSSSNFEVKLALHRCDAQKIEQLKSVIYSAEVHGEFKRICVIRANQYEEGDTQKAHIEVG